jgi:DNA polymerase alpha subunit A
MSAAARAKLAELRALRASGKKRLSTYEVEDQGSIYDEVDEEGYKKVVRKRLDEDDFVVDDNGEGYADDGREVWNEDRVEYSDSEEDDDLPARGKAAKRKREEEKQRKEKMTNGISKYFNTSSALAQPKPKVCSLTAGREMSVLTIHDIACGNSRRRGLHGRSLGRCRYQYPSLSSSD